MERKFLEGLELDKEKIDRIMTEHGKSITDVKQKAQENETKVKEQEDTINTYKTKIADLEKVSGDNQKITDELNSLKQSIADNEAKTKSQKDEEILTNNIKGVFGDKKFINEYTQNAIIGDIKTALKDANNQGKSAKDLFEELTKDKEGIFTNPNQVINLPGAGTVDKNISQEAHDRELIGLSKEEKK